MAKPACDDRFSLLETCFLAKALFLEHDPGAASGDCTSVITSGLRSDSGGEFRFGPLRTWQVGHSLTNREISSFGTLHKSISDGMEISA